MFRFLSSYIALWLVVLAQGVLILAVLQQLAKLRNAAVRGDLSEDRLPDGSKAPDFTLPIPATPLTRAPGLTSYFALGRAPAPPGSAPACHSSALPNPNASSALPLLAPVRKPCISA